MKSLIVIGGLGICISEETYCKPKSMIEGEGRSILWHILNMYFTHGVNEFVIFCGYKDYVNKEYFTNYFLHMFDVTLGIIENRMVVFQQKTWCGDQQQGGDGNSLCEAEITTYEAHQ